MSKLVPGSILGLLLLAACSAPLRQPAGEVGQPLASVTLVPFIIDPHQVEGEVHPVPGTLIQELGSEANASATRALVRSGLTSRVEPAPAEAANLPGYRVTGVVRVPLFLSRDELIHSEMDRNEPFVTAAVTLIGPDGGVIRTLRAILAWEDLHGPDGAPVPPDRSFEEILRDAVRQAVEEAIDHLGQP